MRGSDINKPVVDVSDLNMSIIERKKYKIKKEEGNSRIDG
jgi:hypothetical protein